MQIPHMRTNPTKHRFQDNTYARHFRCPQSQYSLHRDSSEHAYITPSKTSNLQLPGMRAMVMQLFHMRSTTVDKISQTLAILSIMNSVMSQTGSNIFAEPPYAPLFRRVPLLVLPMRYNKV